MATHAKVRMNRREKRILGFVSLAHGVNHTADLTYAAVLGVVVVEFHSSLVVLGLIATISALAFGLSALPAGFLNDRIGSKATLSICFYASAGSAALVAASPTLWLLGVTLAILGLTGGLYHPAGIAFITRGVRQRARALGYHGVAGNIGTALAPPLAIVMVGVWSWRAAFLLVAVLSLVVAVIIQRSQLDDGEEGAVQGDALEGGEGAAWDRQRYLLPLLAVLGVNLIGGFTYRAVLTYLPLHFQQNLGIDLFGLNPETIGGLVAGVVLFFGAVGQAIGGHLGERYRREVLLLPLAVAMVPALWAVGFSEGVVLIVAASLFAFVNFMAQPSYTALVADYTPSRTQGRMYGVMFTLGEGMGSLGGVFGGWIAETAGVAWVFPVVGVLAITIVGLTVYLSLAAVGRARYTVEVSSRSTSG